MGVKKLLTVFAIFCAKYMVLCTAEETPNYKLVFDKLDKNLETENVVETELSFNEGDTLKINGEIKQLVDLDDSWQLAINILRANENNGDYKPMISFAAKGICEILQTKYKTYFYETVKQNVANAPEPTECPLLQRTYMLKDYELDTSKYKKFLQPGYYRVVCILSKDDENVLEYVFDGHVEEDN